MFVLRFSCFCLLLLQFCFVFRLVFKILCIFSVLATCLAFVFFSLLFRFYFIFFIIHVIFLCFIQVQLILMFFALFSSPIICFAFLNMLYCFLTFCFIFAFLMMLSLQLSLLLSFSDFVPSGSLVLALCFRCVCCLNFLNNAHGKVAGRTAGLENVGRNVALTWRRGESCAIAKLQLKPHMLASAWRRISHALKGS